MKKIFAPFFIIIVSHFFSGYAQSDVIGQNLIQLLEPQEGVEVIAKKPIIKCNILHPFSQENLLVMLDGEDITGVLDIRPEGFEYKPIRVLSSGVHSLRVVLYMPDGKEVQKDFVFSTRHSKTFEDAYSNNELTTIYTSVLEKPEDVTTTPYSKIESNFKSETRLKNGHWEFTLTTNLRYIDQSLPLNQPERKGLDLINYLLQGKYSKDGLGILTEIGDVQINETENTVMGLAKRGGNVSFQYKDLTLRTFLVKSQSVFGYRGGVRGSTGIEGSLDDHIMGVSGETFFLSRKVNLKTIYVTGGETGDSFGTWTDASGRKGSVAGFVLGTDFFNQKLATEAEVDFSRFDADTTDDFSADNDKAYKLKIGRTSGNYVYEALYKYIGPDYQVLGNQGLQKNTEGFTLSGGMNLDIHSVNLSLSRYSDNVEDDELYPKVYAYQGAINYTFKKFQSAPISLSYQKSIIDSSKEPSTITPIETETDTITGGINYIKDRWNFGIQTAYSSQNDRTSAGNDSTSNTYTFITSYVMDDFSISPGFTFNRLRYPQQGTRTDTYTTNLDIRGKAMEDNLSYGLAGTYNRTKAGDGSSEQDTINTNLEVAYSLGKKLFDFLNPSAGIRGTYNKTNNKVSGGENDELILLLVLSTSMPFSF